MELLNLSGFIIFYMRETSTSNHSLSLIVEYIGFLGIGFRANWDPEYGENNEYQKSTFMIHEAIWGSKQLTKWSSWINDWIGDPENQTGLRCGGTLLFLLNWSTRRLRFRCC